MMQGNKAGNTFAILLFIVMAFLAMAVMFHTQINKTDFVYDGV